MTDRPPPDVEVDPRQAFVLDEARRTIDQQKRDLRGLRTRAAHIISYATVVISVLGGLSLRNADTSLTCWTWVALAAFAVAAITSANVLRPRTLTLVSDVEQMGRWIDEDDDINHVMRSAALSAYTDFENNRPVLQNTHRSYLLAVAAVLVEVSALLFDLAGR